jgi:anthraniloyl-CoA monooxygenase
MAIRVACVGGGPGGLFFTTLLKRARPDIEVVLIERNQPDDAFGFGVVFSDRTLDRIDDADPALRTALDLRGVHWDSIGVSLKGETFTFGGNGMAAVHRKILLRDLQDAARGAGVDLRFGQEFRGLDELADFDVIVAADGANSRIREELEPALGSTAEAAVAKFIWFGTTHIFDRLTFLHRQGPHGNFAAHAYPIGQGLSTFIVETDEDTWRRAGLDGFDMATPPGASDEVSKAYLRELFADDIDGADLVGNNSRWGNFRTRRTKSWHSSNVALLGDAVHTAHFSVGSGTKMAMEDAIVLARELATSTDGITAAFERYEQERQPDVARVQNAAGPSLSWWEHFAFYYEHLEPLDFAFHFFSRSIDIERIRRRDSDLAERVDRAWLEREGAAPLATALAAGGTTFDGRALTIRDTAEGRVIADQSGNQLVVGSTVVEIEAPVDEHDAPDVHVPAEAQVVVVHGGTSVSRSVVAERARLDGGRVAIIVDDDLDDAAAATVVLSGRADAVARKERVNALA